MLDKAKEMVEGANFNRKLRFDNGELAAPRPHVFDLPDVSDLKRLARWLERDDLTLQEFGEKLVRYPGLSRYVVAVANYRAVRKEALIRDPTHAAAFLGISGLERLFAPLISG